MTMVKQGNERAQMVNLAFDTARVLVMQKFRVRGNEHRGIGIQLYYLRIFLGAQHWFHKIKQNNAACSLQLPLVQKAPRDIKILNPISSFFISRNLMQAAALTQKNM